MDLNISPWPAPHLSRPRGCLSAAASSTQPYFTFSVCTEFYNANLKCLLAAYRGTEPPNDSNQIDLAQFENWSATASSVTFVISDLSVEFKFKVVFSK